jgi:hypothetical protein
MDAFFQENRDFYINHVAAFKPSRNHSKDDGGESGGDTSIAARVRPLLPREIEENEVFGITVRPQSGFADVHELRRKVNGQSALSVKGHLPVFKKRVLMCLHSLPVFDLTRSMVRIRHRRMSTMALSHRWFHGHGEAALVLCLPTGRQDLERRTA